MKSFHCISSQKNLNKVGWWVGRAPAMLSFCCCPNICMIRLCSFNLPFRMLATQATLIGDQSNLSKNLRFYQNNRVLMLVLHEMGFWCNEVLIMQMIDWDSHLANGRMKVVVTFMKESNLKQGGRRIVILLCRLNMWMIFSLYLHDVKQLILGEKVSFLELNFEKR